MSVYIHIYYTVAQKGERAKFISRAFTTSWQKKEKKKQKKKPGKNVFIIHNH